MALSISNEFNSYFRDRRVFRSDDDQCHACPVSGSFQCGYRLCRRAIYLLLDDQLGHGTADEALDSNTLDEAIKLWTNVHGLSQTPMATDTPASGITRTRYGGTDDHAPVEANSLQDVSHNLPVDEEAVIRFFNLDNAD